MVLEGAKGDLHSKISLVTRRVTPSHLSGSQQKSQACPGFFCCGHSQTEWSFAQQTLPSDPQGHTESCRDHLLQKSRSIGISNSFLQCVASKTRRNWMIWGLKTNGKHQNPSNGGSGMVVSFTQFVIVGSSPKPPIKKRLVAHLPSSSYAYTMFEELG